MSGDLEASFALANRATRRRRTAHGFQRNFTKMNRSDEIDSYLSLDGIRRAGEYAAMLTQPYQLYVERTDKARNMARYYAMAIEPGLFGEICLTRRWGRIGVHGQMKVQHFASERDAVAAFLDLLRQNRNLGYRVAPSAVLY